MKTIKGDLIILALEAKFETILSDSKVIIVKYDIK